ncbi:TrbI/VirB10 family protein [Novosphingobium aquimarinum]|uniref:TrbI/VirB10 family protein n=1 Tax=Novosphingobium aquimarinum TaxID=2682494 RepID=UPI0012EB5878|nr:TrbI/VirB10 family protein [Novosphingobium aquimarinum]
MAPNTAFRERRAPDADNDPRESEGAEVIDLATRSVLPQVSQRKKADGMGLAAGVLIVAALGAVTLWSMDAARNGPKEEAVQPAPVTPAPAAPMAAPPMQAAAPAPAQPRTLAAPAPQPVLSAPPVQSLGPQSNPHASPTVVFDAGGNAVAVVPGAPSGAGVASAGNAGDDFAARIGGVGGAAASAARSFDPATTVSQGTLIPAVLETAIDTSVPGYVRAIVSTDVRSFDGKKTLIPRSSRLIGEYKSSNAQGQKRAYVVWTRLIRPDGVSVNLGSPAIGFGGETGLKGKVNSHFFERFGSAMLLSVVGGLTTLAGNASVVVGGGSSAAAQAVQQGSNVGPTIRVRQGEPIRVFTAKDLDFSQVS